MRLKSVIAIMFLVALSAARGHAHNVIMTFDSPQSLSYYSTYGIHWGPGFYVADHSGSAWGPPRSGTDVLAWSSPEPGWNDGDLMFKDMNQHPPQVLDVFSVGGYFSTEPGAVLQMIGYHGSFGNPVATVTIGDPQGSWNNVYVEIGSDAGMYDVWFAPVTANALSHFCADDITVSFIPEPSSLLALLAGLGGLGMLLRQRRAQVGSGPGVSGFAFRPAPLKSRNTADAFRARILLDIHQG